MLLTAGGKQPEVARRVYAATVMSGVTVVIWVGILGLIFFARDPIRYWTRIIVGAVFAIVLPIIGSIIFYVQDVDFTFEQIMPELLVICLSAWCLQTGLKNRRAYKTKGTAEKNSTGVPG